MGTCANGFLFKNKKQFKKWKKSGSDLYLAGKNIQTFGGTISDFLRSNGYTPKYGDIDVLIYVHQIDELINNAEKGFKDGTLIDAEYILEVFKSVKKDFKQTNTTCLYIG